MLTIHLHFHFSILIHQLVVAENIYLLEALGGSGGPGGNPGRLAEDVGLRPR